MTSFRYGYSYGFITRWNRCFICQNRRRYELWKERGVDRDSSYSQCLGYQCCRYVTDLYALSRYFDANHRASVQEPQVAGSSRSEQEHEEANLRLSQLQHQLPANEPGALMHLVQHASSEVEEDEAIRDCKNLFLNKKFFLSCEVSLILLGRNFVCPLL